MFLKLCFRALFVSWVVSSAKLESGAAGLVPIFLPLMEASPTTTMRMYDDETAAAGGSKLLRVSSGVDGCHANLSVLRSSAVEALFPDEEYAQRVVARAWQSQDAGRVERHEL